MVKYKIRFIQFFVIIILLFHSVNNYAKEYNFERESVLGGFYPVIPIDTKISTILFMGGMNTRENKLE